ncbi:MAG: hypothetical protein JO060_05955 [Candidatus Eremiobacteraeota bacterium]|nr:hypothetical protein [Candidatus Eremiobacteraeota bacterium]
MNRLTRIGVIAVVFAGLVFGAATQTAWAKTYEHGHTIWFGNDTLTSDDVVNGDLTIIFGDATCDGATITGDVRTYFGHFESLNGCDVGGELQNLAPAAFMALPFSGLDASDRMLIEQNRHVFRHLAWAVVVLFAFLLFPLRVRVALERVEQHPGLSAAVGTLAAVAVVPLAILLLLSVIGIPLIVVEFAALLACLWIGHAAVSVLIGRRLFELLRPHTTPSPLGALLLGLLVVVAGELLPVFGWVVMLLVGLIGLGGAILGFVREAAFTHAQPLAPGVPPGGAPMRSA